MGLMGLPDSSYIPIAGQLSTYPTVFSMPFTGMAVLHRSTKTVDLFFTAFNENEPTSRNPGVYDYLSLQDICNEIGAKGLYFQPSTTSVTLVRNNMDVGVLGRCGLKMNLFQNSNIKFAIGRVYTADLNLIGSWGLSDGASSPNVIRYGDQYTFTVLGATMVV